MSKKAEEAAWAWAVKNKLDPYSMGQAYGEGYEQAEKDTIERAWEWMTSAKGECTFDDFKKAMEED